MAEFEKMDLASADLVAERIDQLKQLLPEVATEGGIDFDKLRLVGSVGNVGVSESPAQTMPFERSAASASSCPVRRAAGNAA